MPPDSPEGLSCRIPFPLLGTEASARILHGRVPSDHRTRKTVKPERVQRVKHDCGVTKPELVVCPRSRGYHIPIHKHDERAKRCLQHGIELPVGSDDGAPLPQLFLPSRGNDSGFGEVVGIPGEGDANGQPLFLGRTEEEREGSEPVCQSSRAGDVFR